MSEFNTNLYSFIYVELYRLTVLGRLRQSDYKLIESKVSKSVSETFKGDYNIELQYKDVTHGYSGEWDVHLEKKKLFKKRLPLKFDLNDKEFSLHKKSIRNITIDTVLTGSIDAVDDFVNDIFEFSDWCKDNNCYETTENRKKWKRERNIKRLLDNKDENRI